MKTTCGKLMAVVLICIAGSLASADLVGDFQSPPDSAKPWVYWWWLDSNVSKEGITLDLEEMRRQGIGGALVFDAGDGQTSPVGPRFMSPEWVALFKHAVMEADRLKMQLSFNICSGWNAGGTWVTPEHATKKLTCSHTQLAGPGPYTLAMPAVTDGYYEDLVVVAHKGVEGRTVSADCVTLTDKMDGLGVLTWEPPAGVRHVFRFGVTINGNDYEKKTKSASRGAQGYEIDFYSRRALDLQFAETAGKLAAEIGDHAGKTVAYLHDDSWECGEPTWTPGLREEFIKRRGYDPFRYLASLANAVVESEDISARFTGDFKRTLADLFSENHYGYLAELAAKHGMGIHPESGGPFFTTTMDPLMNLKYSAIPMGEFWIRRHEPDGPIAFEDQYPKCDSVKQAATAAHIYGKKLCQAEAFTNMGRNWEEAPYMLKDLADRALCAGLTRHMLCFYVHQPYLDIKPGYEWPAAGTHFDRNITWWDQMDAFTLIDYYGIPKHAYYSLKRACAPILPSFKKVHGGLELHLTTNLLDPPRVDVNVELHDVETGMVAGLFEQRISMAPHECRCLHRIRSADVPKRRGLYLCATFDAGHGPQTVTYFPHLWRDIPWPEPGLSMRVGTPAQKNGEFVTVAALKTERYARCVNIGVPEGVRCYLSDNFFDMIPGQSKTVEIASCVPIDPAVVKLNHWLTQWE